MKKLIAALLGLAIVTVLIFLVSQSAQAPEDRQISKDCAVDEDCVIFGKTGDCNCGCYNKDHLPSDTGGKCFCMAPVSCYCQNGKCNGVIEEPSSSKEAARMLLAEKYNKDISEVSIDISKETDKHIRGGVVFEPGGPENSGFFLAAKTDEVWSLVHDGQGTASCSILDPYDFPVDMVGECLEEETGEVRDRTEEACLNSGGEIKTSLCCNSTGDYPNLCLIGACGCSPDNSHHVKICDCGEGKCFNGKECIQSPSERVPLGHNPSNSTYTIGGELVTLQNGYAEQEILPGSATKIKTRIVGNPVFGDINSDRMNDALVILSHDTGGSGTFYYLAAAVRVQGGYRGTQGVILGDRIIPQSTYVNSSGLIWHNYLDRMPWEPFSASPSIPKTKYLTFEEGELRETPREILSPENAESLVKTVWGDCSPGFCKNLEVRVLSGQDGIWYIQAVYEGLEDDSIEAEKRVAWVYYESGFWKIGKELLREYSCKAGRGHQDFSAEPCL